MKIRQRNTAIVSYYDIQNLPEKRRRVFDALLDLKTACNMDISKHMGRPINEITPRTNELVALGIVVESHRAINPDTGKRVIYWMVAKDDPEQMGLL